MRHFFLLLLNLSFFLTCHAEQIVWSGEVNSNGTPTVSIPLVLGQKYQIKASGIVNLGKWWQQGKPFANDACYEFNPQLTPTALQTLKNSLNLPLGDGSYHINHVYESAPFMAVQSGIHFWIYDTNYADNSGSLHVEILKLEN